MLNCRNPLLWIEVAECDLLFGSSNGLELIDPDFVVNRLSRACGCCPTARRWRSGGVFDCSPSLFRAVWAVPKVLPVLLLVLGVCHGGGKRIYFFSFQNFSALHTTDRGVDSFLNSVGVGSSVRGIICPPGLNRVNWSAKIWAPPGTTTLP